MFVTSKHGIERLNGVLDGMGSNKKELLPFQALVRVQLAKGYQVMGADLISVHRLQPAKAESTAGSTPAR